MLTIAPPFGDTDERRGRVWIGVCDGGVVALEGGTQPVILPWTSIAGVERVHRVGSAPVHVVVGVSRGAQVTVSFAAISDRAGLARCLGRRRAQPPSLVRYPVVGGVMVVVAAVAVWQVVLPEFVVQDEDTLPATTAGFSRACVGGGTAFTHAAAYTGRALHPIVLFAQDEGNNAESYVEVGGVDQSQPQWNSSKVTEVQLVACIRRTGDGEQVQTQTALESVVNR